MSLLKYLLGVTTPPSDDEVKELQENHGFGDVDCPQCGRSEYVRETSFLSMSSDTHRCVACKITFTP